MARRRGGRKPPLTAGQTKSRPIRVYATYAASDIHLYVFVRMGEYRVAIKRDDNVAGELEAQCKRQDAM